MKVVVIRFSSLGDLALMIPMLNAIKRGVDDCTLHVVTKEEFKELLERVDCIDRLLTIGEGSLPELYSLFKRLKREKYDVVIDAHNVARSKVLYHFLDAPVKLQLKKESVRKSLLIYFKINLHRGKTGLYDRYMHLARSLVPDVEDTDVELISDDDELQMIERIFKENDLQENRLVAIAPGARWKTKLWPDEYFAELVMRLKDEGLTPVLVGGENDTEICKRIRTRSHRDLPDLSGRLSVLGTAQLLKRSRVLVTNDSAPLHLAELVGTPVVAMYGPTVREFGYFPRLKKSIALEKKIWCRPCSRNGSRFCPVGTLACLKKISVDEVFKAVMLVLDDDHSAD